MVDAVTPILEIYDSPRTLSEAAAEFIARTIRTTIAAKKNCAIALAGGRTPREAYALLADRCGDTIPWDVVHVFWTDERCVPPDDPDSNFGMARQALLGRIPVPPANIHRIRGELTPTRAAEDYESDLRSFFCGSLPSPAFDLVILGAGAEGHTASLFPGSPALDEASRWAAAVEAPDDVPCRHRVTLTLWSINRSRRAIFLLTGEEKRAVLHDLCRGPTTPATTPSGRVRPEVELRVFADAAAAGAGHGEGRP